MVRAYLLRAGLAVACALATTAAMAAPRVVAATGPSARGYPVGSEIAANARITLQSGDRLTLLDNGKTRVIVGPAVYDSATGEVQAQGAVVATNTNSRRRVGAVRSVQPPRPAEQPAVVAEERSEP